MKIEFLYFDDCPNYADARRLLDDVISSLAIDDEVHGVNATDPAVAARTRFPGSPTIRVDGQDIDPGYSDPGD